MLKNPKWKHLEEDAHDTETEGTWAVSYGDMVTLLLTFFILYFSTNPSDNTSKKEALKISLVDTMREHSAYVHGSETPPSGDKTMSVSQDKKEEKGIDHDILKVWNGVAHDMGNHIIVEFPGVSFFKSGEIQMTESGKKALQGFIKVYMPYAGHYQVSIRAFTDTKKVKQIKGRKFEDNLELSALRSVSSLRELQHLGLPLNKMKLGGYGELQLTVKELEKLAEEQKTTESADLKSLSRRIVLVIEPEET